MKSLGRSNHTIKTKYCQPDRYWYNIAEPWNNQPAKVSVACKENVIICIHADFNYCRHFGDLHEPGGTAVLLVHIRTK